MRKTLILAAVLAVIVAASAGISRSAMALFTSDPAAPYLGMSEAQIIACAGEPHSRFKSGADKETLTYHYSGAGPVPAEPSKEKKDEKKEMPSIFGGKDKKKDKDWTCTASFVFESGKLVRVTFAHKDVHSPYDWQKEKDPEKQEEKRNAPILTCTFSLPRCAPAQ